MENATNSNKRKASETSTEQRRVVPRLIEHEVKVPSGYTSNKDESIYGTLSDPVFNGEKAKAYSFQLDTFQEIAVSCLERQESVLVSAHTSAGKTAVAEYAIAMALRDQRKLIYTSPLKALSNQKYQQFREMSSDVGLITGDISLSPNARCLVMTTEILRQMIVSDSQTLKDVAWVVFDEVHYMNDRERGVVWEESIILLPPLIKMVFLSATMSNASEFAQWICNTRKQPCHLVYTGFRPTPLHHYAYPVGVGGKILLVGEDKLLLEANFLELQNKIIEKQKQIKETEWKNEIKAVVKMTTSEERLPIIIFSFSTLECETYAMSISKYHFNTNQEEDSVGVIFQKAMLPLSEEDRDLSEIKDMLPLLKRGIAVHHSGLFPIIKELVEILFQKGLVKVLFATETFAMGLNMPAKTVLLTSAEKWDGVRKRYVQSSEYIQMSGRAGRRDQDEHGESIIMIDEQIEMNTLKDMVLGEPAPLVSAFRLSFKLILNLLARSEVQFTAEHVMQNSFSQFQYKQAIPHLCNKIAKLEKEVDTLNASGGGDIAEYNKLKVKLSDLEKEMLTEMTNKSRCLSFLVEGRLVKVEVGGTNFGWGVIVCVKRTGYNYTVDTLLQCSIRSTETGSRKLYPPSSKDQFQLVALPFSSISALSRLVVKPFPKALGSLEVRRSILLEVRELEKKYPEGIPKLNPLTETKFQYDAMFIKLVEQINNLEAQLYSHPSFRVEELCNEIQQLKTKKADLPLEKYRVELKNRLEVLTKLNHIDDQQTLTEKGQAARLINTGDELLAIEVISKATFNGLDHHGIAALASCFIQGDKSREKIKVRSELAKPFEDLKDTARSIAEIQHKCKLTVDIEEYVNSVSPLLMDPIYRWSKGSSFSDITTMTSICGGDVIRLVRRLNEFLNQLRDVARAFGNASLAKKFDDASESIYKGLMVANSLHRDD